MIETLKSLLLVKSVIYGTVNISILLEPSDAGLNIEMVKWLNVRYLDNIFYHYLYNQPEKFRPESLFHKALVANY